MIKRIYAFAVAVLLFGSASAQKSNEQMGGVYYAYPLDVVPASTSVPSGYRPFYISHYGRHGSRWLPDEARYKWVNSRFADKRNLTPLGRRVRRQLRQVWKNARGHGGQLTPLGEWQHRSLAARMLSRYPEVFQEGAKIEARSSVVNRCRASMHAFCAELEKKRRTMARLYASEKHFPSPLLHLFVGNIQITDSADMAWMAFTSDEERQLEAQVRPRCEASGARLMASLFRDPACIEEPDRLMSELFTIASDMQDVQLPINLYDIFTHEEMRALYAQNNRRMWICNGLAPENNAIPQLSAVSLWQNIEQRADEAIARGGTGADLRFGHDTSLYRLLSLMGMDLLSSECPDRMDEIVPMAANLQMVFCSNGQNVIVLFRHNEREVRLAGLAPTAGSSPASPYYDWAAVKEHVRRRIADAERRCH